MCVCVSICLCICDFLSDYLPFCPPVGRWSIGRSVHLSVCLLVRISCVCKDAYDGILDLILAFWRIFYKRPLCATHIETSHVTHMNAPCLGCAVFWRSESCLTYEGGKTGCCMLRNDASCHANYTHEFDMTGRCHVTHMNTTAHSRRPSKRCRIGLTTKRP